jgi:hypothetical protein
MTAELRGIFEFKTDEFIAIPSEAFFFFIKLDELCFMSCDVDC